MSNNIIDARGLQCPKPLILTKKTLNNPEVEEAFKIVIDNKTAKDNIERFLQDNNVEFQTNKSDNDFIISISKTGKKIEGNAAVYCIPSERNSTAGNIICIKSDKMGEGNDDLGRLLMQGYINTIIETGILPEKIVFYNSGVKLVTEESNVAVSLMELEKKGVKIVMCGTCVDFYGLKDKINFGVISNMYDISDVLIKSGKIIYP